MNTRRPDIAVTLGLAILLIVSGCAQAKSPRQSPQPQPAQDTDVLRSAGNVADNNGGVVGVVMVGNSGNENNGDVNVVKAYDEILLEKVAPLGGVTLPVKWKDVLVKAVKAGAVEINKYETDLARHGARLTPNHKKLLLEGSDENISFTPENALFNLNMLWTLGLVNRNPVLTEGRMSEYGDDKKSLASVGAWTLGSKSGAELFASAEIITLTQEQQNVVDEVAANAYRPCCANPTAFPDCNHGMAALALAELMASQGATKEQIYDALFVANRYWFTQQYMNIAAYLEVQGKDFSGAGAKELLGANYSGSNGNALITKSLAEVPRAKISGARCGV